MIETLLQPADCLFFFVDYQAGLAFGVESIARQAILNNAISLARTATVFNAPIVASTSASKVYSGPLLPSLQAVMPSVQPIERRNMNAWEDDKVRAANAHLSIRARVPISLVSRYKHGIGNCGRWPRS
jgi:nicotinamidase-related amidase